MVKTSGKSARWSSKQNWFIVLSTHIGAKDRQVQGMTSVVRNMARCTDLRWAGKRAIEELWLTGM